MNDNFGEKHHFVVSEEYNLSRIDVFLSKVNDQYSRSYIQKLIKSQKVLLNDQLAKSSSRVMEGDEVDIDIPLPAEWHITPQKMELDIIYEDSHLLVINKPAGMVVHPGAGVWENTLVNGLLAHCGKLSSIGGVIRPGIVHRLDKNTSGLLVIAKNDKAHQFLQKQFQQRTLSRKYLALVWGHLKEKQGRIEAAISRSHSDRKKMAVHETGKDAITYYTVKAEYDFCSLLEIKLGTGRTHQIRVHMKYFHHPVFGDPEYNGRESQLNNLNASQRIIARDILNNLPYQFLHARYLEFIHPESRKKVIYYAKIPINIQKIIDRLSMD